jgi:hypothetical protein
MTHAATLPAEVLVASLRGIADHSFDSIMITRGAPQLPDHADACSGESP